VQKWKLKALVLAILVAALVIVTAFLGWDNYLNWLIFLSVAAGIFVNMFSAQGHWVCFVFSIISYALYIPFCLMTNYYGELIVSMLVIGANLITLFKWKKNTKNKVAAVSRLSVKEILICCAVAVGLAVGLGFVFMLFDTAYPFLNSVCTISIIVGFYFAYRISRNEFITAIINGIAYSILWVLAAVNGDGFDYLLFAVGGFIGICYSIYGFIHWGKLYRKQNPLREELVGK